MSEVAPQPAGGFGAPAPNGAGPGPEPNGKAPDRRGGCLRTAAILAGVGVVVLGGLGALGFRGFRQFERRARTADAKMDVQSLALAARESYDPERGFCPSASAPVPADAAKVSGKKYVPTAEEWRVDAARTAGFACLGFEREGPRRYQLSYRATKTSFTATARGDLDGDGVFSTFEMTGTAKDGAVVLAPSVVEISPEE